MIKNNNDDTAEITTVKAMTSKQRFLRIMVMGDGDSMQLAKGVLLAILHDDKFVICIDGIDVPELTDIDSTDKLTETLLSLITVAAVNYRILKDIQCSKLLDVIYIAENVSLTESLDGTFTITADEKLVPIPKLSGKLAKELVTDDINLIAHQVLTIRNSSSL